MFRCMVLLALIVAGAATALADDDPRDLAILKKLGEPTRIEFRDTPLADAIEYLNDFHGISIDLDSEALKKAGISDETPITQTAKDIRLWQALRDMLKPHRLSFMIKDHQLTITSQDEAREWQRKNIERP